MPYRFPLSTIFFYLGLILAILSMSTILSILIIDSPNLEFCGSSECFQTFLEIYSPSLKLFSAAIALITISFAAHRIIQNQEQLDNQSEQIRIQQDQIDLAISSQLKEEYGDKLGILDDDKHLFSQIKFKFKENIGNIMPEYHRGKRTISKNLDTWLLSSVLPDYMNLSKSAKGIEKYQLKTYAGAAKKIIQSFENLFDTSTNLNEEIAFNEKSVHYLFRKDKPSVIGSKLYQTLSDILFVVENINTFYQKFYFSKEETQNMRSQTNFLNAFTQTSIGIRDEFNANLQALKSSTNIDQFKHLLNSWKSKPLEERQLLLRLIHNHKSEIPTIVELSTELIDER